MITWDNYEEYMIMHADGELRPDEEQALMAFVNKHPQLKKELSIYDRTRLTPDTKQVFADKNSLLKPVPVKRAIALPQWGRYSIAAGIAALIFIGVFEYGNKKQDNSELANADTIKQPGIQIAAPPVVAKNTLPGQNSNSVPKQDTAIVRPAVHADRSIAVAHKVSKEHKEKNEEIAEPGIMQHVTTINGLSLAGIKELPDAHDRIVASELIDTPVYIIVDNSVAADKTFLDKLPIADDQKKQIQNIAGFVVDAYEKVNAAKQNIQEKSLTIRIEKGRLLVSF